MTGTGSMRAAAGIMTGPLSTGSIRAAAGIMTGGSIRADAGPMTPTFVPRLELSSLSDQRVTTMPSPVRQMERQMTPMGPERQRTPLPSSLSDLVVPLPVPASKYIPDNTDAVDMALSVALWRLDAESVATLWLRRVSPSVYEVDRRRVSVSWRDQDQTELLVLEDEVPTSEPMPMLDYLRQVASITMSLAATKKVAVTPERSNSTLTPGFQSSGDPAAVVADCGANGDSPEGTDDKITSMMLACEEAGVPEFPGPGIRSI